MNTRTQTAGHTPALIDLAIDHPTAERIRTDDEAIDAALRIAAAIKPGAASRDRGRIAPYQEIDAFSNTGLWAITVPRAYGGPELSTVTLCKVFQIISEADPSIGQIPQNHFTSVDDIKNEGSEFQKRFFFDRLLRGDRIGSAFSEAKGSNVLDIQSRLTRVGEGAYLLNGEKFYCTGALFAHWLPVLAIDDDGREVLVVVSTGSPGVTIVDDWSSFGQRTTASGTVRLHDVAVSRDQLLPTYRSYLRPTNAGAFAQIMHAAVDAGIAAAAINDTVNLVNGTSRAWIDAHVDRASEDPLTIVQIGDLEYRLHGAVSMLERAARVLDESFVTTTTQTCAAASVAVAEARIATTEIAILAANKLFELAGARSTMERFDLDRHWRNARTHTLHDPVRWKYHAIGNYYLNGENPPRHNWI